ncbi:MAG: YdcF family protein [Bacteroidetes bacterium]|nr:YdcF family protein [Bacteroidota bacterium]
MDYERKNYLLIDRKVRWGLTVWGWILLILILIIPACLFFRNLYSILSPVQREKTTILALEGFVSDYVLTDAIREFRQGHYSLLVTTGTPIESGGLLSVYKNTARVAAESLKKLGFDSTKLVVVETDEIMHDRTYNSGLAFKYWLRAHRPDIKAVNLMTMSVHGARSRVLFQAAMGDSIRVGIISLPNIFYGPSDWWHSSKGFREVINEAIGYYYVKIFFRSYKKELKGRRN